MNTRFSINDLPLAESANQVIDELKQLAKIENDELTGARLLYERAYMFTTNPTSYRKVSCKLLKCRDSLLAVNLSRESDWEMIPAWLGPWFDNIEIEPEGWNALQRLLRSIAANDLLDQANCLGLAVSIADHLPSPPSKPWHLKSFTSSAEKPTAKRNAPPLVVDLSSLWAGPLCSHLLSMAGCRVIKVESVDRLDGARGGLQAFYQLLNQGKESLTLHFKDPDQISVLEQLLSQADIIIEGSRPRALRNLGIDAEALLSKGNGQVWVSITGFGRDGEAGSKVGYGDDAAAAAGLSQVMYQAAGEYHIVGDAIADPITGIHAALAAWKSYLNGGNTLISLALKDTVSYCLHRELKLNADRVHQGCRLWLEHKDALSMGFPEGARKINRATALPGQHNREILQEFRITQSAHSEATSSTTP